MLYSGVKYPITEIWWDEGLEQLFGWRGVRIE
jgi:hypothetical protein